MLVHKCIVMQYVLYGERVMVLRPGVRHVFALVFRMLLYSCHENTYEYVLIY